VSRMATSPGLRRLRAVGLVVGVAMGAAAMMSPVAQAQSGGATALPVPGNTAGALPHDKLPAGAVPATRALPKVGARGATFAARAAVTPNIVGGTLANSADFPSVVGIVTQFLGVDQSGNVVFFDAFCTGTVISPTKVLTAGHCATDLPDGTTEVIAGRNDLINDITVGFVDGVGSTWTDPTFNLGALNAGTADVPIDDVAVLTLTQPLPSAYPAITLTGQNDSSPYAAGTNATIVGYGITTAGASDVGVLRQATVPIQSDATCAVMTGYQANRMTCAGFPAGGIDTCNGDSGGPLLVNNVEAGITDWGAVNCAAAGTFGVYERLSNYNQAITADLTRPALVNQDWTGDGHSDLLARNSAGGLFDYFGSGFADDGFGGFGGFAQIGSGWNIYSKLFRVTNWNGDGTESIMAETPNGTLFQYLSDGQGDFTTGAAIQVGTGFNIFSDIMVVNNWTGDGHEDLIGRTPAGALRLYESDGHGGWVNGNGVQIGTGFNAFDIIITPGSWTGDGNQTLIGRTPGGALRLYESDGHGGWVNGNGVQIGSGFNAFSRFFSPGDWNGDDMVDLIGVTPGGAMVMYTTDGHGNWITGVGQTINGGWQGMTAIF
jgi:hypothetical protein